MNVPSELLSEIRRLLALPLEHLSSADRRHLGVIQALAGRLGATAIGRKVGLSREQVRKISNAVQAIGLEVYVHAIAGRAEEREVARRAIKKTERGRPRARSLAAELRQSDLAQEPVVALASLIVARDAQFAVIAVRDRVAGQTLEVVRKICRRPETAQWRDYVDEPLRRAFLFLRGRTMSPRLAALSKYARPPALSQRFNQITLNDWNFIALCSGDRRATARIYRDILSRRRADAIACDDVVSHLEAAVSTLRVEYNLRGLLPYFEGLFPSASRWRGQSPSDPFEWHATQRRIEIGLKNRVADFYMRMMMGVMYDLSVPTMKGIPISDSFRVGTFRLRPTVKVRSTERGESLTVYSPFPGIEMTVGSRTTGPAEKIEKELQSRLQKLPVIATYDYAVRPQDDQRVTMFPEYLSRRVVPKEVYPTAVVLVPRHFLMPRRQWNIDAPPIASPPARCFEVSGGNETFHVVNLPELADAVATAFSKNRYHERLRKLAGAEMWWRDKTSGPSSVVRVIERDIREHGRANRLFPDFRWVPEAGSQSGWRSLLDNKKRTLLHLYRTLDADFLLRGIPARLWTRLLAVREEWAHYCRVVVQKQFDEDADLDRDVPRDERGRHGDKALAAAIGAALYRFEASPRMFREIIEHVQRTAVQCDSAETWEPRTFGLLSNAQIMEAWSRLRLRELARVGRCRGSTPPGDPVSAVDATFDVEVRETVAVLKVVLSNPQPLTHVLRAFYELARDQELNIDHWRSALSPFSDEERRRVEIALKFVHKNRSRPPDFAALLRILSAKLAST